MRTLPTLRRLLLAAILSSQSFIALARNDLSSTAHKPCPSVSGNITLEEYQLYPENADWDSKQCLLYFGALYNGTIAVYDPYKAELVQIIELENNVSYNPLLHTGGVDYDARTGLISLVASAAPPFYTRGNDTSGPNFAYLYDPTKPTAMIYTVDLNAAVTHGNYTGFQDSAQDPRGNVYVAGTYSASIIRISPDGQDVKTWYVQEPVITTRGGFSGIASTGDILLVGDKNGGNGGRLVRFDSRKETGVPFYVPLERPVNSTLNTTLPTSDAVYLPPKYNDTVILMAQQAAGTAVIVTKDNWESGEFKGYVPCATEGAANGSQVTANVQITESIYTIQEWFDWPPNGSLAGNRITFPMIDITKEVDDLVRQ